MALTALKIYDNTNTQEAKDITVIGYVDDSTTYTIPEDADFGTAIVKSCHAQTGGTAITATVSSRTVTFDGDGVSNTVVALTYTFQK